MGESAEQDMSFQSFRTGCPKPLRTYMTYVTIMIKKQRFLIIMSVCICHWQPIKTMGLKPQVWEVTTPTCRSTLLLMRVLNYGGRF